MLRATMLAVLALLLITPLAASEPLPTINSVAEREANIGCDLQHLGQGQCLWGVCVLGICPRCFQDPDSCLIAVESPI